MELFRNIYRIPPARLALYDYGSHGFYFVTICTKDRINHFVETQNFVSPNTSPSPVETQYLASQKNISPSNEPQNTALIRSPSKEPQNIAAQKNISPSSETNNIAPIGSSSNEPQNIAALQYSRMGEIAFQYWMDIPKHFPFVELDEFIVMPNHVHGILFFNKPDYQEWKPNHFGPQSKNLASVIRGYKAAVKKYAVINEIDFAWQPRYHDHVIRSEKDLNNIRQYIIDNPQRWADDKENSNNVWM